MSAKDMTEELMKAQVLVEALPYIQKFNRKIIVVKYGGSAMVDEELKRKVIQDVVLLKLVGFKPIIVHGGGKEISKWVEKSGMTPEFKNGLRVTDEPTMEIAEMVLNKVNKSLVSMIEQLGVKACGISGKDGGMLKVEKKYSKGEDIGYVGEVTDVDTTLLDSLLKDDFLPVICPIGYDDDFHAYNINADDAACAIARALVNNPRVLLLDEPLAALDYKLRKDMQNELRRIQRQTGITFIFVTHDQEEALSMSDTVVVMNEGKIQQIGSPTDIYNEPKNAFVADFIGESNIVDGVMLADYSVKLDGRTFECLDKGFLKNEPVDVVIRPEDVDIVPVEKGMLEGEVTSITFKGDYYEMIVDVCGFKWMVQATDEQKVGAKVGLIIEPDAIHIMKKSEYSGVFGDYSTFSDEMDQMDQPLQEEGADE